MVMLHDKYNFAHNFLFKWLGEHIALVFKLVSREVMSRTFTYWINEILLRLNLPSVQMQDRHLPCSGHRKAG